MKTISSLLVKNLASAALVCLGLTIVTGASAANLVWDANGATAGTGGTGNWTGGNTWSNAATGSFQAWADGNNALFIGTAGNVTLNANVVVANVTNVGAIGSSIIGSGVNSLDFGASGTIASGGNAANLRISAKLKGAVTLNPLDSTLANTSAIWVKANNTNLTSVTVFPNAALGNIIADDPGVFGSASSSLLVTNGGVVNLGALSGDTIAGLTGSGGGISFSNVTTTLGGGYLRSRAGANTWNGPVTITAANSGFMIRGASGVSLTLPSSATINLNTFTLVLNTDSGATGSALTLNGVVSGSGGMSTLVVSGGANGNGLTTLGAANTFGGVALTTQNLGTLALNNVNALQNATLDTGASGSQSVTFVIAGNNTYNLGALQGSDALAIGGNTISVGTKAVDTTFGAIISGSGGKLTKVGANKLTLNAANSYDGLTTISSGTLALGASGLLAAASSVSLAAGATFDVSAQTTYTHGSSASLTASGTGTTVGSDAAEIKGGTTVDLGSRPVTVNFAPTSFSGDATHPALYISSGALSVNGGITVNNTSGTALDEGTYTLISQASGSISGAPSLSGTVGGSGIASGKTAFIQVSGAEVQLVVQGALPSTTVLTRHAGTGTLTTYGDMLQFDVTVSGSGPTPSGTVELRDGGVTGTLIGSGSLSGGSATINPAVNALAVGSHANIVALYTGDLSYQSSASAALSAQTVSQLGLTVSGATAANKFYDTTTTATVTGGSLVGVVSGDSLNVTLVQSGAFATAGPGTAISVTATCSLTGPAAGNYSLTQPTGLAADIIAAAIWTNIVSGAWSTNANWTNNLVGTGANVTADFSQVDLTADIIVTNDVNRTIGNMIFGDSDNSTAGGWVLTNNTITLAGTTPTITVNTLGAGSQVLVRSIIAGTSGLTKAGPGFLTLSGANTYTGGTVVSNGVLNFNNEGNLGTLPGVPTPANIVLNGGTLALVTANQNVTANRGVALGVNGGTISNAVVNAGNLTVSGVIAGPGALTVGVSSAAGVIINGQNTYSGGTTLVGPANSSVFITVGTVGSPGSLVSGPFGTGSVTFNGPGTRSTTGADTINGNAITFAADTTFPNIASEKTLTLEGPVTISGNRTLTVNIGASVAGKSLTVNGSIGDGGNSYALTKAGSGNLVLSAANAYTGGTTNAGGVLILNHNAALSSGALVTTNGNTRVTINDGITITNDIIVNGGGVALRGIFENSGAGNATLSGSPININAPLFAGGHFASTGGGTLTVAKPVNSSVAVSIRTGTVIMSGGGSYTDANITGIGRLGANNGFCSTATIDLGLSGAAVFDLAGFNQTLAGLTRKNANSAIVTNSATGSDSTLTLTTLTTNFPGVITDSGVAGGRIALVVNGGSHTLSGANTYNGNTTISAGTLNLTGSLGGTSVTNVAGALTGTGVINGAVVVQGAALLNPGVSDSLGESLIINNNLTLAGTTIVQIGAAPACDSIAGVADINYGGTLIVTNATGATLAAGNTFNLFSASGTKLNNFSSVVLMPADPTLIPSFDPATGALTLSSAASPTLSFTNLGGSLQFSWTGGGTLQAQTNSLSVGLGTNWVEYPGSSPVTVPVDSANGSVFFRVKQ